MIVGNAARSSGLIMSHMGLQGVKIIPTVVLAANTMCPYKGVLAMTGEYASIQKAPAAVY